MAKCEASSKVQYLDPITFESQHKMHNHQVNPLVPQIPTHVEENASLVKWKQYESNECQRDEMECVQ